MQPDNLIFLKDDMIAFIAGHGMRRIPGQIGENVPSVTWEDDNNPDGWKDFVETAKACGAPFVTMSDFVLEKEDVELLLDELAGLDLSMGENGITEEAHALVNHVGKTGFIQLGFVHQGVAFIHESSTAWYDNYQHVLESVEDFGDIVFEQNEDEDE
ncbi:MAG: hypothetical protein IRZ03_01860 [Acidobacterium ailaaui]|nr:hypothetical protein [Pseudacidobacterium ailaaui]MBX6358804.1 hypothetical protein [Pseudacidobacterium ailaaui]MCL6464483.1 hypothetical protein [Pseudacidobacterium ailaaui]MDI3253909.1 hypothetical protein [Bacillota bacterium]